MDEYKWIREAAKQNEDILKLSRELNSGRSVAGSVDFSTAQNVIQADFHRSMAPYATALEKALQPTTAAAAQAVATALEPMTAAAARSVATALEPMTAAAARSVATALEPLTTVAAKAIAASLDPLVAGPAQSIARMLDNSGFATAFAGIGSASSVRQATAILASEEFASAVSSMRVRTADYPDVAVEDGPTATGLSDTLRRADPLGLIFLRRRLNVEDLALLATVVSVVAGFAVEHEQDPEQAMATTLVAFILLRWMLGNMSSIFPDQR